MVNDSAVFWQLLASCSELLHVKVWKAVQSLTELTTADSAVSCAAAAAAADLIDGLLAVDDITYSFGRPLNKLARLFVDESLIERLKDLEQQQHGLLSPTFIEEANEARMLHADWLRLQGVDACAWLANAVASSSSSGGGG
jgi:hypothetical protein